MGLLSIEQTVRIVEESAMLHGGMPPNSYSAELFRLLSSYKAVEGEGRAERIVFWVYLRGGFGHWFDVGSVHVAQISPAVFVKLVHTDVGSRSARE